MGLSRVADISGLYMSGEGFVMSARLAEVFFRWCARYKVEGRAERVEGMRRLVAKRKVKYIRDATAFMKGKKVLHIKGI